MLIMVAVFFITMLVANFYDGNECAHILDNVHGNLRKLAASTASASKLNLIHAPPEALTMHEAGVCEEFCKKCSLKTRTI